MVLRALAGRQHAFDCIESVRTASKGAVMTLRTFLRTVSVFRLLDGSARRWGARSVAMAVLSLLVLTPAIALADAVDDLIDQLDSTSEKVRLSAVLSLTKVKDARAIGPLSQTLAGDGDRNVRSAAATGLGKIINDKTPSAVRKDVLEVLTTAAEEDASSLVRKQAESARAAIAAIEQAAAAPTGKIFVEIGPMATKSPTGMDSKLKELMRKTAQQTLGKSAPDMMTSWPGGKPSKAQLAKKGVAGFYVDGTLTEIKAKEKGASTLVSCKISLLIATYPEKSMFAFLQGSASVSASQSAEDVELAHQDCVAAVIEDMIARKAVAALQAKAGE